jgi:hypothetical protein
MAKVIECGELTVNSKFRLFVTKHCKANGIREGDRVKVTIEKVE